MSRFEQHVHHCPWTKSMSYMHDFYETLFPNLQPLVINVLTRKETEEGRHEIISDLHIYLCRSQSVFSHLSRGSILRCVLDTHQCRYSTPVRSMSCETTFNSIRELESPNMGREHCRTVCLNREVILITMILFSYEVAITVTINSILTTSRNDIKLFGGY